MTGGPLDRPADPSTTPPMTDADVETLWAWPEGGLRIGEFDPPTAYGIAVLLREIDRARAAAEVCACVDCMEDRSDKEA